MAELFRKKTFLGLFLVEESIFGVKKWFFGPIFDPKIIFFTLSLTRIHFMIS